MKRSFATFALIIGLCSTTTLACVTTNDTDTLNGGTGGSGGSPSQSSGGGQDQTGGQSPSGGINPSGGGMDPMGETDGGTDPADGQNPADSNPMHDAVGVNVEDIVLYQTLERPLVKNHAEFSYGAGDIKVPIIAGRKAWVRVFVDKTANYDGKAVTARLFLNGASTPIEVKKTLTADSSASSLNSTFNFDVPASEITTNGLSYRVELKQAGSSSAKNDSARFPKSGTSSVDVDHGVGLKIKIIPVVYKADKSNRLPDTSPAQLAIVKDYFESLYPIADVDISVGNSMNWSLPVKADGSGWSALLEGVHDRREADAPPDDVYYFGLFEPAKDFKTYCANGCTDGKGYIPPSASDAHSRVAIGTGFSGLLSAQTMAHEVGHNHGRKHVKCSGSEAGPDPSYPTDSAHAKGSIGVWGYDPDASPSLLSASTSKDIMSYCSSKWISDYTYSALFERALAVEKLQGAQEIIPEQLRDRVYERVQVDEDGHITWGNPVQLAKPPMGEPMPLFVETAGGRQQITGDYYEYDHGGGVLYLPVTGQPIHAVEVDIAGARARLER